MNKYRFGFNGQERDVEINPSVTGAPYWEYDARTAHRWNVDPVLYPWHGGYTVFNDNPIYYADPDGDKGEVPFALNKVSTEVEKQTAKQVIKLTSRQAAKITFFEFVGTTLSTIGEGAFAFVGFMFSPQVCQMASPNQFSAKYNLYEPSPWQIITTDPSELTDDYLQVVADRMLNKKAVGNDQRDYQEFTRRNNRRLFASNFMGTDINNYGIDHIDYTKPVYSQKIGPDTYKNKRLVQWREPGKENASPFFTFEGEDPSKLGIPSTYTEKYYVELDKEYTFLRSTANEIDAFRDGDKGTYKGGGTQLFSRDAQKNAKFTKAKK